MKNLDRVIMVQSMVNTLIESIHEYEGYKVASGCAPKNGDIDGYHTGKSIKRRIVQARKELLELEKRYREAEACEESK